MKIIWYEQLGNRKCIHCNNCIAICPQGALKFKGARLVCDEKKCTMCGQCIQVCPEEVIRGVE